MMQWTAPLRYVVAGGSRRGFFRFKGRLLVGVFVASFLLYQLLLSLRIQQQQAVERTIEKDAAKCRTRSRFVYIKMFKTASTTLSNMFKRFGLLHNLTFVLPPKNKIYIGWPYQIDDSFYRPSKSGSRFDILCEHTVYNATFMDQLMGPNTVYLTSIREPFSQFKSMVNYYNVLNLSGVPVDVPDRFSEYMTNIEKYEMAYKLPMDKRYCVPDGFSMSKNLMSFNLGFPTGGFWSPTEDQSNNDELIASWISSLDSKFNLVLVVEYFVESIVLLRRLMCWTLPDVLFHSVNSLPYNYRSHSDDRLVNIYRRWSRVDYVLYDHFNRTLWKRIAMQGDDFWKEVAHFRQVAAEVETFCQASGKSQTKVVAESEWNEKFIVNNDFCILLGRQLLQTLQDEYEKLPPLNIAERPPTKWTC